MAGNCNMCNEWKEHYYWNHLAETRMHFLKTMMGDFYRRMSVPKKFVKNFKGQISEVVALKGPSGNIWHVGLTKADSGYSFQSGWKDFVKDHHIEEYDILVFRYDGNSCFDVLIFDEDECQKSSSFLLEKTNPGRQEKSDDSVEILNVPPRNKVIECISSNSLYDDLPQAPAKNISGKSPMSCCKASCKIRTLGSVFGKRNSKDNELVIQRKKARDQAYEKHQVKQEPFEMDEHKDPTPAVLFVSRRKPLTSAEEKKASKLALKIQPRNPYFAAVMQPTNVSERSLLTIPVGFRSAYLTSATRRVILQTPANKKQWSVRITRSRTAIGGITWRRFVLENSLKEGDICLFELITKQKDVKMRVHFAKL